jgi:hypothetical protein
LKARRFTKTERAQRRENNLRHGLSRNLILGYDRLWWTKKALELLGKLTDADVAARIGKTVTAVKVKRIKLGIATAMDDVVVQKKELVFRKAKSRRSAKYFARSGRAPLRWS